jgi:2-polyprenyl-3-methyl-5-hydroxy-6-metoxy-1,4-benzoquinol methylase
MSDSADVENTMSRPEIHDGWAKNYRTSRNEKFFRLAFARILNSLSAPRGAEILDAGCGTCRHSVRFHRQGCSVRAVDFSDSAIERAR